MLIFHWIITETGKAVMFMTLTHLPSLGKISFLGMPHAYMTYMREYEMLQLLSPEKLTLCE
jgi:hypothetical protein